MDQQMTYLARNRQMEREQEHLETLKHNSAQKQFNWGTMTYQQQVDQARTEDFKALSELEDPARLYWPLRDRSRSKSKSPRRAAINPALGHSASARSMNRSIHPPQ